MPQYSTLAAFEAANELTKAEQALITACRAGEPCTLGDGARPQTFTASRHIRADLLRLLITGGSKDCGLADDGVFLVGAWITGELNLSFAKANGRTIFFACHFTDEPNFDQAYLRQLSMQACHVPGLLAQLMIVEGSVYLRHLYATGTVHVNGAKIGGQLALDHANLDTKGHMALNAQGMTVEDSLSLINLNTTGTVHLSSAQVSGPLDCMGAKIDGKGSKALNAQGVSAEQNLNLTNLRAVGTVDLNGAQVGGQLSCVGASFRSDSNTISQLSFAFQAQRLRVHGGFIWRNVTVGKGLVSMTATHVGDLVDDLPSWPTKPNTVFLDGFIYDRIASTSPTDAASRLHWLDNGAEFNGTRLPQPYTHLAKVLADMGHERDARKVLFERERLLAQDQWAKDQTRYQALRNGSTDQQGDLGWQWLRMWSARLWSSLIRRTAGYGYAPERALYWTLGFVGLGWLIYFLAWQLGAMVPNSAIILTSADWADAMKINPINPAHEWTTLPTAAHYETFYALPYAADVFVPLVDLGQQSAWSQTTVTWSGWATRLFTWALQIVGWIITALGAAAVTGIIKRDRG